MERLEPIQKDYYCVEEAGTDGEYSSSSEDEVEEYFAKLAGVSSRSVRHGGVVTVAEQRDEFENEMDTELNEAFKQHSDALILSGALELPITTPAVVETIKPVEEVDPSLGLNDPETDSDEDQEKLAKPSNDDLFYDPEEDKRDQDWVDKQRRSHQPLRTASKQPNSDAVLNCPCCMALLCLDCQRHSLYKTQYRAMFVSNCRVKEEQRLVPPSRQVEQPKSRKRKSAATEPQPMNEDELTTTTSDNEIFQPVVCSICNTEVAVRDTDEVYHFFNVLSSYT